MQRFLPTKETWHEFGMYMAAGTVTSIINWILYAVLVEVCRFGINVSNATAWIVAMVFSYFMYRKWVFESDTRGFVAVSKEMSVFMLSRLISGLLNIAILPVLLDFGLTAEIFGIKGSVAKIVASFAAIALNYVCNRFLIFKAK